MSASTQPGSFLSDALADAYAYALELHAGQVRKQAEDEDPEDGIPYVGHLMMVAALVIEHGGSEAEAIAALLHDGPEDQGGKATLAEIRKRFGAEVADIVDVCTDTLEDPKPPWWRRKRAYCRRLRKKEKSDSAILVSLADKTHNLEATAADVSETGEPFWDRFTQGRHGSLWYYATLLKIYQERLGGGEFQSGQRLARAARLVDRLEVALERICPDEEERRAALEFGPESSEGQ